MDQDARHHAQRLADQNVGGCTLRHGPEEMAAWYSGKTSGENVGLQALPRADGRR